MNTDWDIILPPSGLKASNRKRDRSGVTTSTTSGSHAHARPQRRDTGELFTSKPEPETANESGRAERLAHAVVDYVLSHEIGGRWNALKCVDASHGVPLHQLCPRLCAERAVLQPVAKEELVYVLRSFPGQDSAMREQTRLLRRAIPLDALRYRQSLSVCDYERDLTGGLTGSCGPTLRAHLVEMISAGCRGEDWKREDEGLGILYDAADERVPEAEPLDLFGAGGDVEQEDGSSAFSLDAYLQSNSSGDD